MRVGYLGVGNMGQPMAGKLLEAGHELWIYDVRAEAMRPLLERQARPAASPQELADACDTVVVSLPTLDVFRAALSGPDGLLWGKALKTLVNTCTVGVAFTEQIVETCAAARVTVIELMPVFRLWGPTVVVAGEKPGAAQVMKLTNNIVFVAALIATSEAMTMATKAGIAPEAMLQILNNGTGRNFATTTMFPQAVLTGTFDFGATIDILMKDVDLAIEQGEALGVPMWVCQAARLVVKHGVFQGRAGHDVSRIVQIIEDGARTG